MTQNARNIAKGIFEMCLAAVSFGFMAACVKWSAASLPSHELVFFRSFLGTAAIAVLIWKNKISWVGHNIKILLARGITGFLALTLHFYAIAHLDLGTAVMLNYTAPIFVTIFARFILKEKTTWQIRAAIILSFIGLFFLASPKFNAQIIPFCVGLLSGIFAAFAYLFIRYSDKEESPYTIIFYFTAISAVGSLPLLKLGFYWPDFGGWLGIFGVTAGAFFGQIWLTKSIRRAPVSIVMPFGYLAPVFSSLIGFVFWGETLSRSALAGGALIIISGAAIYLLRNQPQTDETLLKE